MTGGRDLRALFSTNDRTVSAEEAFANRQAQWNLVADALAEHLQRISSPGFDVEDLEAPRNNVIVLHGVGGIGKSTLSRKLEAALADAGQRPPQWGEPGWPDGRSRQGGWPRAAGRKTGVVHRAAAASTGGHSVYGCDDSPAD